MDQVLVDFVGGVCERWGLSPEEVRAEWPVGMWQMTEPLTAALAKKGRWRLSSDSVDGAEPMTLDTFWQKLEGDESFWTRLKPLPWAEDLLLLVQLLTEDWHIVSSPSRCDCCYSGKVKWLHNYFGQGFDRFALTPHKYIFASPDVLLTDDREENCQRFVEAGGSALVFPQWYNVMHRRQDDPVAYLREMLTCYAEEGTVDTPVVAADDGGWDRVWRSLGE
jgi:hypothetical protein